MQQQSSAETQKTEAVTDACKTRRAEFPDASSPIRSPAQEALEYEQSPTRA